MKVFGRAVVGPGAWLKRRVKTMHEAPAAPAPSGFRQVTVLMDDRVFEQMRVAVRQAAFLAKKDPQQLMAEFLVACLETGKTHMRMTTPTQEVLAKAKRDKSWRCAGCKYVSTGALRRCGGCGLVRGWRK